MSGAWLREEQTDLAVDKILEAASRAFVDLGVSRTRMGHIAQYAGCSRGTLYRYFKTRAELDLAYIDRSARLLSVRLESELKGIEDPRERIIEGILMAVTAVRESPDMSAWFEPLASGRAARASQGSQVIGALSAAFVGRVVLEPEDNLSTTSALRGRWIVRVIVSLLTMPGQSEEEERAMVERYAVPASLTEPSQRDD
jgi:AcrR family transcriptional regulator